MENKIKEEIVLNSENVENKDEKKHTKKVFVLRENEKLREESKKVFEMSDGTMQAEFYSEPVHFYDEKLESFVEIDNEIEDDEDGKHLRNRRNKFVTKFSKETDNDELFTVENEGYTVKVSSKEHPRRKMNKKAPKVTKANSVGQITYANMEIDTDYKYTVNSNNVKEDIVLKKRKSSYKYSFILEHEGLNIKFKDDGAISLENTENKEVFFIPAPFMYDANDELSTSVRYEVEEIESGKTKLHIVADKDWINAEERSFPVTIDPQLFVGGKDLTTTYMWTNGNVTYKVSPTIGNITSNGAVNRMYMEINQAANLGHHNIKKMEMRLHQYEGFVSGCDTHRIGVYKVTKPVKTGSGNTNDFDLIPIDYARAGSGERYLEFDITKVFDDFYGINENNPSDLSKPTLLFKMLDEDTTNPHYSKVFGCQNSINGPILRVTYTTKFSFPEKERCETHKIGNNGMGYVDLQSGDLFLDLEDFSWQGQRMPISIKHYYNNFLKDKQYTKDAATGLKSADFSAMKLGYGWRINYMQSMVAGTFSYNGGSRSGYIFIDGEGNETYFKLVDDATSTCSDYEDTEELGYIYNHASRTLTMGSEKYIFDDMGRLIKITNGKNPETCVNITYSNNRIVSISDGVYRSFLFQYNSANELIKITAPDGTSVNYSYSNNRLSKVTYPNGQKINIATDSNGITDIKIQDASNAYTYKVEYRYVNKFATVNYCVSSVTDYMSVNGADNWINPKAIRFCSVVASNKAYVEHLENGEVEKAVVYSFDEDGNLIGNYEIKDGSKTPLGSSGENDDGSSDILLKKPSVNMLTNHGFEKYTNGSFNGWSLMSNNSNFTIAQNTNKCKFGRNSLNMVTGSSSATANGIYQTVSSLAGGKYAFSAYVYCNTANGNNTGVYLRVRDNATGAVIAKSELIRYCNDGFVRIVLPFEFTGTKSVRCEILADGYVNVNVDAAQLENNDYATPYNMLENGSGEASDSSWVLSTGATRVENEQFHGKASFKITGSISANKYVSQAVKVLNGTGNCESFTLSGWAKAPCFAKKYRTGENTPVFRLRAVINYVDSSVETHYAEFSAYTDEWQTASVDFAKASAKVIDNVTVYCEYGYALGEAFFDNIQLIRNDLDVEATFLTETDSGSDSSNDTSSTVEFTEATDAYGNPITETNYAEDGIGTFYRSFQYQNSGNDLYRETDERGYNTFHIVDAETSLDTEVVDRCGNRTYYEYDTAKNVTKTRSTDSSGTELANVSYGYDSFNNLKEITRGDGMKYALVYNDFNNLESIGVVGKNEKLISYTYKNGRGKLKQATYANGHTMKATYNSVGQLTSEKWYTSENGTLVAHYGYVYDSNGNIVRSIDFLSLKEYNYIYDEGRIVRSTECNITLSGEIVTSKTVVSSISYHYTTDGKLSKKVITPASGDSFTYTYNTSSTNSTPVSFVADGYTVTAESTTDSLGRKTSDSISFGYNFLIREFTYHSGAVTQEHRDHGKVKSAATTRLVKKIELSDGRTLSYEYDGEERITKVIDSVVGTTEYTYDALGQLLTEKVNGAVVNTMSYDNYGNIVSKNGVSYTYNSVWKDLLTKVGNSTITYDSQGNPTSYLGHDLTWEKGRQLKSFDNNTYTYNARGFRTSKTVNGVKHTYTLDGTNIIREEWSGNVLVPLYDDEESVCGIIYNNVPYYFRKNLQGDIISIANRNAVNVATYTYDAWGKCTITSDTSGCNIANINPFRYREYYFDTETGLYYLQSRYYDSSIGRFISGDEVETIDISKKVIQTNVFAYCVNSPVNFSDFTGRLLAQLIARIILGGILGFFVQFICDVIESLYITYGCNKVDTREFYGGDYLASILSWSLIFLSPASKTVRAVLAVLPYVVKMCGRLIKGGYTWTIFIIDLISAIFAAIVAVCLGGNKVSEKKLNVVKKMFQDSKNAEVKIAKKCANIVLRMNKKGFCISIAINITNTLIQLVAGLLVDKKEFG